MAIGPQVLTENFMNDVKEFEKIIDNKLIVQRVSPNSSIRIDVPKQMHAAHLNILRERYIKAGWKEVIWNSDQREGEWLTFKS